MTWRNSENRLSRRSQLRKTTWYMIPFIENVSINKSIDVWSPRPEGMRRMEGDCQRYRVSFRNDENVLKWMAAMAAQGCEYAKPTELYTLNE